MGFKESKAKITQMERDREISRIGNLITQQVDAFTEEYKRKIASIVHHILKDELK